MVPSAARGYQQLWRKFKIFYLAIIVPVIYIDFNPDIYGAFSSIFAGSPGLLHLALQSCRESP